LIEKESRLVKAARVPAADLVWTQRTQGIEEVGRSPAADLVRQNRSLTGKQFVRDHEAASLNKKSIVFSGTSIAHEKEIAELSRI